MCVFYVEIAYSNFVELFLKWACGAKILQVVWKKMIGKLFRFVKEESRKGELMFVPCHKRSGGFNTTHNILNNDGRL